ncbi:unnamed protein product [Trichobilharzia regenti]|nr:unnamed protein product [Trichobilharzia regenti]
MFPWVPSGTRASTESASSLEVSQYLHRINSRVTELTEEEMMAAGLKSHERDYCAHILVAFRKCQREHVVPAFYCSDLRHMYLNCHEEDRLLRMKEYERERRLLQKRASVSE